MRRTRIIPVILIHKGGVYKTTKFKKPVYIGDPINTIRLFNELEVDEIIVLDIDASRKKKGPNFDLISDVASEAFMPFGYGGGISSVDEASQIFQFGVEKVILNHVFQKSISIVTDLSNVFGSQSIVVSIDYKRNFLSRDIQFDHVYQKSLKLDPAGASILAENRDASHSTWVG